MFNPVRTRESDLAWQAINTSALVLLLWYSLLGVFLRLGVPFIVDQFDCAQMFFAQRPAFGLCQRERCLDHVFDLSAVDGIVLTKSHEHFIVPRQLLDGIAVRHYSGGQ